MNYKWCAILAFLLCLHAAGQELPSSDQGGECHAYGSSVLFGMGHTNQLDTYLSPVEYSGMQFSVLAEKTRRLNGWSRSDNAEWSFQSLFDLNLHLSKPKSESARYLGGDLLYDAALHHNWHDVLVPCLTLYAGGQAGLTIGGIYTTRGGNNPANAHAALRLAASAGARYNLHIGRLPLSLRYQADLPLLGAAFSPNFGQSYYELWDKGGYDHNIVATYPGNGLSFRQLFTASLHFGSMALTLGYLGHWQQAKMNHLRQHQFAHSFLIGWTRKL